MSDDDIRVSLCSDCVQLHANGETPHEYDEGATETFLSIVRHNTAGFHVVVTCHECDDYDCEHRHVNFSPVRCDSCGTWLAGDRCPGVMTPADYPGAEHDRTAVTRMRTWNGNERIEQ